MNNHKIHRGKSVINGTTNGKSVGCRPGGWLTGTIAALSLIGAAQAQVVSLVLSNDASLKNPSYLTTDGTNLYVDGVGTDNSQHIFMVPINGGAATILYGAYNPLQITIAGTNFFWIDPNSGPITDTQIFKAPDNGAGPVTAIYTGSSQGQPIVDGSGLASDGILLYAADEVAGTVWRMKLDGSALTQLGPPRYSGGFGPEHLNTVAVSQGVIYLADSGRSGSGISPAVVSIGTNGVSFTTLASGAPLVSPDGIAVGGGNIYVADASAGNTIWVLPIGGGTPSVLVQGGVFKAIQGLCYLNGDLFVCDTAGGAIYKLTLTQPAFQTATYVGTTGADLTGLAIKCSGGAAYVAGNNSAIGGFLQRYNTPMANNASTAWNVNWPGSNPSDQFYGVTASAAGVYAAGPNYTRTTDLVGGKEGKGLVVKFPLTGATGGGFDGDTWDIQTPAAPGAFPYGGFEGLRAVSLAGENGTNYFYVTGSGQHDGSNGGRLYVSKLSDNGSTATVLWTQTDGAEMVNEDYSTGVAVTGLNTNVYVAGLLTSAAVPQQAYLRKYNSAGGLVWVRADNYASCYNGVTALGNAIYAVGWSGTNNGPGSAIDFLIEKWDENGNQIWARAYDRGGAESCLNGVVAMGDRLFVTGYTRGMTAGGADAILIEIDPATGAALSSTTYGGPQDDVANGIDTDGTDLYLVGTTRSFGNGSNDVMVLRYSLQPSLVSLGVTPANPAIGAGTNLQFTATGHFTDGSSQTVTNAAWSSGTTGVASINGTGLAHGVSQGTSLITASSAGISNSTLLTVVVHPTISMEPMNVTAGPGGTVTFSVTAGGGSLSYQWQLNGTNIAGATSSSLTLSNVNAAASGAYTVVVSNAAGNTNSTAAELSLLSLNMYAGLTIVGQVGATYEIDYNNSLAGTNWTTLTNLVLPGSPYIYFDTSSPYSPSRFYRALKQ